MNDYLAASNATSLLDMANGAIKERIDYEMGRVMQNISLIAKASSTLQFKSRVNVNIKGNLTRTVKGKVTDTITGDVKQSIKGDVQQKIDGDAKLEVTGNLEVKVGGTTIKATSGGNVTVTAAATCTVNSPIVTIEGGTGDVKVNGISLVHHKHKDGGQGEPEK